MQRNSNDGNLMYKCIVKCVFTLNIREEGQKTLQAKQEMEAEKQRREIEAIAREKREAKEKQVCSSRKYQFEIRFFAAIPIFHAGTHFA